MAYSFLSGLGQVAHFGLYPDYKRDPTPAKRARLLRSADIMLSKFNRRYIPYGIDSDDSRIARILSASTLVDIALLYDAYALSGERKYYDAAQRHAQTTIDALVRPDGGVYVCADPEAKIACEVNSNKVLGKEPDKREGTAYVRATSVGYLLWGLAIAYCHTREDSHRKAFAKSAQYVLDQGTDAVPPFAYSAGQISHDSYAAALYANAFLQMAQFQPTYAQYGLGYLQALAKDNVIPEGAALVTGHCIDPDKPLICTMRADFAFLHALSLLSEPEEQHYVACKEPPVFAGLVRESDQGLSEHPTRFWVIAEQDALRFHFETELGDPPAVRHKNAWENDAIELCIRAPGQDKYADLIVTLAQGAPQWSGWNSVDPHKWSGEWTSNVRLDGPLAHAEIILPHSLVGKAEEYYFDIRRLRPDEASALRPAPRIHDYKTAVDPPDFLKLQVR